MFSRFNGTTIILQSCATRFHTGLLNRLLFDSVFIQSKRLMQKTLTKKLPLLAGLSVLLAFKIPLPTLAQATQQAQISPAEEARPPIEPIAPETIQESQPPPLEGNPNLSESAEDNNLEDCPPLATSEEENRFESVEIEVVGNTVLHNEISTKVACYEGKDVTLSDLLSLQSQITRLYIETGYATSGAFIPNEQFPNGQFLGGAVRIEVIEGKIEEDVQINGLSHLREGYVRARLSGTSAPLNEEELVESLELLRLDPNIQSVNAELTGGSQPGENILILNLDEPDPLQVFTTTDNLRSPSIGSIGVNVSANYRNLIGIGDVISASYGTTEGLSLYDLGFTVPVNATDGTLSLRVSNSDSRIVEDTFRDIGIRSESNTYSIGFRQPVIRTPSQELALGLDFDYRRSQSFILNDVPFSFSLGPEDGLSKVSVLRFSQDWTQRGESSVLAARSQFNLGLDIFDATNNATGPNGQFFSWLGQFQWVEQVSPNTLSLLKFNAQLTPDSLLPLERFSLGGIGTVRGYSQNQLTTDNALNATAELRIPIIRNSNILKVTPFIDAGVGWNNFTDNPENNFLLGTGVGLRWQTTPNLFLRADYGIPLTAIGDRGSSLQDNGLYFSLTYQSN